MSSPDPIVSAWLERVGSNLGSESLPLSTMLHCMRDTFRELRQEEERDGGPDVDGEAERLEVTRGGDEDVEEEGEEEGEVLSEEGDDSYEFEDGDEDGYEYESDGEEEEAGMEDTPSRGIAMMELRVRKRLEKEEKEEEEMGMVETGQVRRGGISSIFSSMECGTRLLGELKEVWSKEEQTGIFADVVGDDIYEWNVRMESSRFLPSSPLSQSLRHWAHTHEKPLPDLELRVTFARRLHPFFPPAVSLRGPRLTSKSIWRLGNLHCLRLAKWRPMREGGILSVLREVRSEIASKTSMDVSTDRLNPTPFERMLCAWTHVAGVRPRELEGVDDGSSSDEDESSPSKSSPSPKKSSSSAAAADVSVAALARRHREAEEAKMKGSKKSSRAGFARGTGYSGGGDSGWDATTLQAAEREAEDRKVRVCRSLAGSISLSKWLRTIDPSVIDLVQNAVQESSSSSSSSSSSTVDWNAIAESLAIHPAIVRVLYAQSQIQHPLQLPPVLLSRPPKNKKHSILQLSGKVGMMEVDKDMEQASKRARVEDSESGAVGGKLKKLVSGSKGRRSMGRAAGHSDALEGVRLEDVETEQKMDVEAEDLAMAEWEEDGLDEMVEALNAAGDELGSSVFIPFVVQFMSSAIQMEREWRLSRAVLRLVTLVASFPGLAQSLTLPARPMDVTSDSVASALSLLASTSKTVVNARPRYSGPALDTEAIENSTSFDLDLAICRTFEVVERSLANLGLPLVVREVVKPPSTSTTLPPPPTSSSSSSSPPSKPEPSPAAAGGGGSSSSSSSSAAAAVGGGGGNAEYAAALGPLQWGEMDRMPAFALESVAKAASSARDPRRIRRLAREASDLRRSLPLTPENAMFARSLKDRLDVYRVGIVGPPDTPYEGGIFFFDIALPDSYPQTAPKVLIITTGGGSVRFNPNLYAEGKVCLSLLGTWEGARGESWNPAVSTLFQVLISIQALIMVPEPYWNEPGYQNHMNDPSRQAASKEYTRRVRRDALNLAIISHLEHPPDGFKDVVQNHFRLRRDHIKRTIQKWVDDAAGDKSKMLELQARAVKLLDAL